MNNSFKTHRANILDQFCLLGDVLSIYYWLSDSKSWIILSVPKQEVIDKAGRRVQNLLGQSPRKAISDWWTRSASRKDDMALTHTTAAPTGTKKPAGLLTAIIADSRVWRSQDLLDCFSWSSTDAIQVNSCMNHNQPISRLGGS